MLSFIRPLRLAPRPFVRTLHTTTPARYPANPKPSDPDHLGGGMSDHAKTGMDHQNQTSPNEAGTRNTGGRAGEPSEGGSGGPKEQTGMPDPGIGGKGEGREKGKAGEGMGGEDVARGSA